MPRRSSRLSSLQLWTPPPEASAFSGHVSAPNSPFSGTLWNTHLSSPVRTS